MKRSAVLQHVAHIASLGLGDRLAIPLIIDALAAALPAMFLNFIWLDENEQPSDIWLPVFMPKPIATYLEADRTLDPAQEPTIGSILADGLTIGANERWNRRPGFHDTVLYNETLRPYGIGAGLDLVIRIGGRARGILFVNREPQLSRFGDDERRLLAEVRPHLVRALADPVRALDEQQTVRADWAVMLVRGASELVFASESAPLLVHQQGGERFGRADNDLRWRRMLTTLVAQVREGAMDGGGSAQVERRTSWGTFLIQAHAQGVGPIGHDDPALIAVTVERRVPRQVDILHRLRTAALSPRERQVAYELTTGAPGEEAHRRLGLTHATWRDYQKRVYDKLQVHSRAELSHRLSDTRGAERKRA